MGPPGSNSPIIEVENLRYRYDDGTEALSGVDFRLQPGETIALLGPNGSGKTTFALHLNAILSGKGTIRVGDIVIRDGVIGKDELIRLRRTVGLVVQDSDNQLSCLRYWRMWPSDRPIKGSRRSNACTAPKRR